MGYTNELIDLTHKLFRDSFAKLDIIGCTKGEYRLLHYIDKHSNQKLIISDISEKMHMSRPLLSRHIKNLEDKELVLRTIDKSDKRNYIVTLSDKGKEVLTINKESIAKKVDMVVEYIGENDAKEMIRLLNRLQQFIEQKM